jgi:hypothetical protein
VKCDRILCPDPYFSVGLIPNAPPDPSKGIQPPYGTGGPSYVEYGTCPIDRAFPEDIERKGIKSFAYAQLYSYDLHTHGWFFWNFRTELESRWGYSKAVDMGWLPSDWNSISVQTDIANACVTSPVPSESISSSPWLVAIVKLGSLAVLFSSFLFLLYIFVPMIKRYCYHYAFVRSGYQEIPNNFRNAEDDEEERHGVEIR